MAIDRQLTKVLTKLYLIPDLGHTCDITQDPLKLPSLQEPANMENDGNYGRHILQPCRSFCVQNVMVPKIDGTLSSQFDMLTY